MSGPTTTAFIRVTCQVSLDGGRTWQTAEPETPAGVLLATAPPAGFWEQEVDFVSLALGGLLGIGLALLLVAGYRVGTML